MKSTTVPDFDRVFERRNTNSAKWDRRPEGYESTELLPMWVADMDFQAAGPILSALRDLVEHGIFGYSIVTGELAESYIDWVRKRQNADLSPEWLLRSGGVLQALALSIRTLTAPGQSIVLQPPVYHPFAPLIRGNDRISLENPLHERDGEYSIDLDHLDSVAKNASALLLCNPHNPVGRVFTADELKAVLEICARRSLAVISDEIHSDIIMPGHRHTPLFSLAEKYGVPMVVLTSPTKTFNLAGIPMAWAIVPDAKIRSKLEETFHAAHSGGGSHFATTAALAAYRECAPWLDALLSYLDGNRAVLEDGLKEVSGLRISPLEGTYLAWLDFRDTGVRPALLKETMLRKTGLWLNAGEIFGTGGAGFQRLNLAAPRSTVVDAVSRIVAAFS